MASSPPARPYYVVTDPRGDTARLYPIGPQTSAQARSNAVADAVAIGGRVHLVDEHGRQELIFGVGLDALRDHLAG